MAEMTCVDGGRIENPYSKYALAGDVLDVLKAPESADSEARAALEFSTTINPAPVASALGLGGDGNTMLSAALAAEISYEPDNLSDFEDELVDLVDYLIEVGKNPATACGEVAATIAEGLEGIMAEVALTEREGWTMADMSEESDGVDMKVDGKDVQVVSAKRRKRWWAKWDGRTKADARDAWEDGQRPGFDYLVCYHIKDDGTMGIGVEEVGDFDATAAHGKARRA